MLPNLERRIVMGKRVFKALVIDDGAERNLTYHNVLDRIFDTEIENDISLITKKRIRQYDLLIIDVCLSVFTKELTAFKLMDDFNISTPTVLISGEWIKSNEEPNEDILMVPKHKNVIKLISWNTFVKRDNEERIAEEIYYDFCKACNISTAVRKDKCTILQLSDLQFGGNESGAAYNDNKRLANYLKKEDIIPDILLITGDIADKGRKEEFFEAKIWIENLIKDLWDIKGVIGDEDRQRVLLVPGNHDYDISISASDVFSFQFGNNVKDSFVKKEEDRISFVHQKLGFKNYFDFAFELTGDSTWKNYESRAIHINEHFLNFGLCFVMFNSVYNINCRNCENKHDEFYCNLSELSDEDLKYESIVNDEVVNILVMHNPPEDYHKGTDAGEKSKNILQTLVEDNHINMCFYGHSHDYIIPHIWSDNGGKCCENMVCISAPTYRLAAASRTEDAMRGFNVIEMTNESGNRFDSISVKNYEVVKADIVLKKQKSFSM